MSEKLTLVINEKNLPGFTNLLKKTETTENIKVILRKKWIDDNTINEAIDLFSSLDIPVFNNTYRLENILEFVSGDMPWTYSLLFTHEKDMQSFWCDQDEYAWMRWDIVRVKKINESRLPDTMELLRQRLDNIKWVLEDHSE